jgi:hypothetical protein
MYQIVAPKSTHFRPATCEEVQCDAWRNGWKTILPIADMRVEYIRAQSGRSFHESTEAGMTTFTFFAGQKCFAADKHMVPLERDPIFRVRENGLLQTHQRPDQWADDFADHLDKIRKIKEG